MYPEVLEVMAENHLLSEPPIGQDFEIIKVVIHPKHACTMWTIKHNSKKLFYQTVFPCLISSLFIEENLWKRFYGLYDDDDEDEVDHFEETDDVINAKRMTSSNRMVTSTEFSESRNGASSLTTLGYTTG